MLLSQNKLPLFVLKTLWLKWPAAGQGLQNTNWLAVRIDKSIKKRFRRALSQVYVAIIHNVLTAPFGDLCRKLIVHCLKTMYDQTEHDIGVYKFSREKKRALAEACGRFVQLTPLCTILNRARESLTVTFKKMRQNSIMFPLSYTDQTLNSCLHCLLAALVFEIFSESTE